MTTKEFRGKQRPAVVVEDRWAAMGEAGRAEVLRLYGTREDWLAAMRHFGRLSDDGTALLVEREGPGEPRKYGDCWEPEAGHEVGEFEPHDWV